MTDAAPTIGPDTELLPRVAARVLLLDSTDRLLLLRGCDPARPEHRYWMTVGGGLDAGETPREAAVRELFEETGLRLAGDDLTGPVFHETTRFPFDGRWFEQEQDFFVARVTRWTVDLSGLDPAERATIDEERWWTVGELGDTTEKIYPVNLVDLLRDAVGVR